MAFRELEDGIRQELPDGASDRYVRLEALGRMIDKEKSLYDHLKFPYEMERYNGKHIPLLERRPSIQFNLAYEITHDTLAELFEDEQFPIVKVLNKRGGEQDERSTEELKETIIELELDRVISEAYEQGVVGSCAVVIHNDNGRPFFEVLPGKWCVPQYAQRWSNRLIALIVTYPVERKKVEREWPEIVKKNPDETYWYRYIIGPYDIADYLPLSDKQYCQLGEVDGQGNEIEFVEYDRTNHGFNGRVPAVYAMNFGGSSREIDGMCLWWPIVDACVRLDYTLSQADRALRYGADPMLFIKRGDLFDQADISMGGPEGRQMGGMATNLGPGGAAVRGVTQTLVGGKDSDAKILEISAQGVKEEREFVRDLREYALEVVGGQKARAQQTAQAASGKSLDKGLKPLRRLVRRQRRPWGDGTLDDIIGLTLYGYSVGAFDPRLCESDVMSIPTDSPRIREWPKDETLQGGDLLDHVTAMQLAAGGSLQDPLPLIDAEPVGEKLAADIGFSQPYQTIKGDAKIHQDNATEQSENETEQSAQATEQGSHAIDQAKVATDQAKANVEKTKVDTKMAVKKPPAAKAKKK